MTDDLSFIPAGGAPLPSSTISSDIIAAPSVTPAGIADAPSTIGQSQEQQVADSTNAMVPMLPYPVSFQLIGNFKSWDLEESKIVLNMLSKWNDSVKEAAAEQRKQDADPTNIRKNEERIFSNVTEALVANASTLVPASATSNTQANATGLNNETSIPAVVTVGLVFAGTGGVRDGIFMDTLSTDMVGVNPSSNQMSQVAVYTSDMRAELGLLGAAMMQGAAYVAIAKEVLKSDGKKEIDKEVTAKSYAEEIIKLVGSGTFGTMINAIISHQTEKGPSTNPLLAKNLEAQLKAILLGTALAALYKAEKEGGTGWLTGADFDGLLTGENTTFGNNKKTMDVVLSLLKEQLASMPDKGDGVRELLYKYFNDNPAVDVLTNPAKVFAQLQPYARQSMTETPA